MLEIFTLRKSLDDTKKELAHSLYQYDAACRVINKLVKENDQNLTQMRQHQDEANSLKIQLAECSQKIDHDQEKT